MKIDLCFACDENYAPYAAVTLHSAWLRCAPEDSLRVWIINDGISPRFNGGFATSFRKRKLPLSRLRKTYYPTFISATHIFPALHMPV